MREACDYADELGVAYRPVSQIRPLTILLISLPCRSHVRENQADLQAFSGNPGEHIKRKNSLDWLRYWMTIVRASVKLHGDRSSVDGITLADTGSSMTVLDREVADKIGVRYTGRRRALVTASGHKLEGDVVVVNKLVLEGEVLDFAHALVTQLPDKVKDTLTRNELAEWIIIGVTTLELLGYVADTTTGKLRKVDALFL